MTEELKNEIIAKLRQVAKQEIKITFEQTDEPLPVGSSRIGGRPDVPSDFVWPTYEGSSYDATELKRRPLSFLAQINLRDVAVWDEEHLLPTEGILSFFYELETMQWGFDPKDEGSARVFWFPDSETLAPADFPDDMEQDFILPELPINCTPQVSLPDYWCMKLPDEVTWDDYYACCAVCDYTEAEDVTKLLSALEDEPLKWRAYIHLLIDTGVRRGEACAIQWESVNMKTGAVTISHNLCYTAEKGVFMSTPKNGKTRTVYISQETIALLRQLREEQSEKCISRYVFTQEESSEPIHPTSPTHYFRRLSEKTGIADLHPHLLRHTFASLAITSGADVASVSEVLGHSDKAVTLRMYTHANEESKKKAASIVQEAIKKAAEDISNTMAPK